MGEFFVSQPYFGIIFKKFGQKVYLLASYKQQVNIMVIVTTTIKNALEKEVSLSSWKDLREGCVRYANSLIRQMIWRGVKGGVPPGGCDGEDIVDTILVKVFEERLTCQPGVECKAFLIQSIKAEVSHLARGKENRETISEQYFPENLDHPVSLLDTYVNEQDQTLRVYSDLTEEYIRRFLDGFLEFVRGDEILCKITKIFIYNGAVFPECFAELGSEAEILMVNLRQGGYLNEEGEVQARFWSLSNYTQLQLPSAFERHQKTIFLIISESLNIRKPREIARWLRLDIMVVFNKRRQMKRYLQKYQKIMGNHKGGHNHEQSGETQTTIRANERTARFRGNRYK
jgi:hypothetical protein